MEAYVYTDGYAAIPEPVLVNVSLDLFYSSPAGGGSLGGTALEISGAGIDSYHPGRNRSRLQCALSGRKAVAWSGVETGQCLHVP